MKTVSRRALAVEPAPPGRTRSPAKRGPHAVGAEERAVERDRGLVEDLVDVRAVHLHVVGLPVVEPVGRPEQQHPLPRHGEGDPDLVVRDRQRRRPVLLRLEHDVRALAEPHRRPRTRFLQAADVVDPRAGGVDDSARPHLDRLSVDGHLPAGDASASAVQRGDLGVVEHRRARRRRGADVGEAQPAVVRPRVRVEPARAEALRAQSRHEALRALGVDEPVQARAGERLVEDDPGLHDQRPVRPAAVEREQERQPADEVRRTDAHQVPALLVSLADEADIAEPQVAQAAVDQLGRGARGRSAEVGAVDERDGEAGVGGLGRDPGADDPRADHEQIERAALELVERAAARVAHSHSGFVHAFRPARSTSSMRTWPAPAGSSRLALVRAPSSARSRTVPAVQYGSRPAWTAAPSSRPATSVTDAHGLHATSSAPSRASTPRTIGPALE